MEMSGPPDKNIKTCPMCGEDILAIAKKCKHCGELLEKPVTPPKPFKKSVAAFVVLTIVFLLTICSTLLVYFYVDSPWDISKNVQEALRAKGVLPSDNYAPLRGYENICVIFGLILLLINWIFCLISITTSSPKTISRNRTASTVIVIFAAVIVIAFTLKGAGWAPKHEYISFGREAVGFDIKSANKGVIGEGGVIGAILIVASFFLSRAVASTTNLRLNRRSKKESRYRTTKR